VTLSPQASDNRPVYVFVGEELSRDGRGQRIDNVGAQAAAAKERAALIASTVSRGWAASMSSTVSPGSELFQYQLNCDARAGK